MLIRIEQAAYEATAFDPFTFHKYLQLSISFRGRKLMFRDPETLLIIPVDVSRSLRNNSRKWSWKLSEILL